MDKIDTAMISGAPTIIGLLTILVGSFVAARAVIITDDAAIKIAGQVGAAPRSAFWPTHHRGEQPTRLIVAEVTDRGLEGGLHACLHLGDAFCALCVAFAGKVDQRDVVQAEYVRPQLHWRIPRPPLGISIGDFSALTEAMTRLFSLNALVDESTCTYLTD